MRIHLLLFLSVLNFSYFNAFGAEVYFESEVQVKKNSSSFETIKSGEAVSLIKGDVALALSPQGLPILLVSPMNESSKISVTNADLEDLVRKQLATVTNTSINEIIDGLRKVEALLQKRDYGQAQAMMAPLRSKYDYVASVLFLNASVSYLTSNKSQSLEDLEKGLKLDPQNQAAQKLLQKIKESR